MSLDQSRRNPQPVTCDSRKLEVGDSDARLGDSPDSSILHRVVSRPRRGPADRIFWSWVSLHWSRWRDVLVLVQPATVIAWQRKRFRDHWTRISGKGTPGRPPISQDVGGLLRRIP